MNYGPLLFLAALFALAGSWLGLVVKPVVQVGFLQATNAVAGLIYPAARPGLAQQGLQVYRANGCQYCHSQQVDQLRTVCEVVLSDAGTNRAVLLDAIVKNIPGLTEAQAAQLLADLSKPLFRSEDKAAADGVAKALAGAGGKAVVSIVPVGPDIARGWGKRRTVAEDYLRDYPVMPGVQRVGPDLANIGVRQPDPNWHLRHLYAPAAEVSGSTMPPYRFLFETRKARHGATADALHLSEKHGVPPGYEVVPTADGRAVVAYLLSLRADVPLFSAPMTVPGDVGPGTAPTNGAAAVTNPASGVIPTSVVTNTPAATNAPAR